MSYIRGDYYFWNDDSHVHIWARGGYDHWDDSGWNEDRDDNSGEVQPSGVMVPFDVVDEFVVMRVARLIETGKLTLAVNRAVEKWKNNGGCQALTQLADRLKHLESGSDV